MHGSQLPPKKDVPAAFLHVGPKKHAGVRESAGRCGRGSMDGAAAVARTAMALEAS
jgi:hypothetical protein